MIPLTITAIILYIYKASLNRLVHFVYIYSRAYRMVCLE